MAAWAPPGVWHSSLPGSPEPPAAPPRGLTPISSSGGPVLPILPLLAPLAEPARQPSHRNPRGQPVVPQLRPVPNPSPPLPAGSREGEGGERRCNPLTMTVSLFSPNYWFLPIWHFLRKICWIMTSIKMEALKNLYAELNLSCTFLILQPNLFLSVFALLVTV